jgi:hypothetical protein
MGVEKRRVEVGPEGFTDEVNHLDIVPRRFSLLPFKGFLGVIAGLEQGSVRRFDHDAAWRENGALVLAGEVHSETLISRLCG